ncbi:MAG: GNAT family N-acetyltransferase [Candidatus Omnitrophica bacterium]|nr:GNAT family N-acetyltransferase [Candidatus Omnitrophota bacterium]
MERKDFSFETIRIPAGEQISRRLLDFWGSIFGQDYLANQNTVSILSGKEKKLNRDIVLAAKYKNSIVSTVHLTVSLFDSRIGGIGEVATVTEHREKGLAKILCQKAIKEFEKMGGKWLFLGTSNPVAARMYHSLGWRYITGSRVMFRNSEGQSPEIFFAEYFRYIKNHKIRIVRGDTRFRLQIIPAAVIPYEGPILDLNAGLFSTRWFIQQLCMGLYPRYESIDRDGAWFVALSGKFIAGISSVKFHEDYAQIDGFCPSEMGEKILLNLFHAAIEHALRNKTREIHMVSDVLDAKKKKFLLKMGCVPVNEKMKIESKEGLIDISVYKFSLKENYAEKIRKIF